MTKTIEDAAREAVREEYLCESCAWKDDCDLCGGENTAFDCCECPADSYEDGFKAGAARIMSLPLASRMTEEEKERVREEYRRAFSESFSPTSCLDRQYVRGRYQVLREIFGKELFEEGNDV